MGEGGRFKVITPLCQVMYLYPYAVGGGGGGVAPSGVSTTTEFNNKCVTFDGVKREEIIKVKLVCLHFSYRK